MDLVGLTFVAVLHDVSLQSHFSDHVVLSKKDCNADRVVMVRQQAISLRNP